MKTADTTNDHLDLYALCVKVQDYMLSVDALSQMEVPYKGELLTFKKFGKAVALMTPNA